VTLTSVGSPNAQCANTDASLLPAYDVSAASKVLTGRTINLVGTVTMAPGTEYVAEALRSAGAKVNLNMVDNARAVQITSAGGTDWDLHVQGDVTQSGTLTSSLLRVMGPATEAGGRNKGGVVNDAGYQSLLSAMARVDVDDKCADLQDAQQSMLERVDVMPLTDLPTIEVTRSGVSIQVFSDYLDTATLRFTE
jgi:peptide/nickel transport system substrate-binding protein